MGVGYDRAALVASIAALLLVYLAGYVTGSLLVRPTADRTLSFALVRTVAGLFLSATALLLSLRLTLPWFVVPLAVFLLAVALGRGSAFTPPHMQMRLAPDSQITSLVHAAMTGIVAVLLFAPIVISAFRMAPGTFPPVFYNVDVPYFLEKVHALIGADAYPPGSLSVLGGQRPYHFGLHAVAALIAQGSGMYPHHALFLVVVPLLAAGTVAAALVFVRGLGSPLPLVIGASLVLVSVPTLWYDFWLVVVPRLREAWAEGSLDAVWALTTGWEMWGTTSNIQNLGSHFIALAGVATMITASRTGWTLPVFLFGSAFLFKSPAGIALLAGLGLAQAARVLGERTLAPLAPVAGAALVFGGVYATFWLLPGLPAELTAIWSPLFHVAYVSSHGGLGWFAADLAWLLLPALVVVTIRPPVTDTRSLQLLAFALAPFVVVNSLRLVDLRRDYGISSMNEDDWRQVVMPVPVLLHACVVSLLAARWAALRTSMRAIVACLVALSVGPPALVAARYASVLLTTPTRGHEYADNGALGAALAVIPVEGTLVVTNDLRYPADDFDRDNLQMQIPALFGHQAFAVNYFYEAYPFSPERQRLQRLLQGPDWTPAINDAAREHGWTHLLVRNDVVHPQPNPLERVFDNGIYSVYTFRMP